MRINDLKIGHRLFIGFGTVLVLLVIVWYTGRSSLTTISKQLEIVKEVNTILTDAQDAQAGSLRFVIYGDKQYYDIVGEKALEIEEKVKNTKSLMTTVENENQADSALVAMKEYSKSADIYYDQSMEQGVVGKRRAAAAEVFLSSVKTMVSDYQTSIKKRFGSTGSVPASQFETYRKLEEIYTSVDAIYIIAYRCLLAKTHEQQELYSDQWLKTVDNTILLCENLLNETNYDDIKSKLTVVIDELKKYRVEVVNFDTIDEQQRLQMEKMKDAAIKVMNDSRVVRDGVYDVIESVRADANRVLLSVSLLAVLLGIGIALFLTTGIVKPISVFNGILEKVAGGDLTQKVDIDSKDEIGDMAGQLRKMIASLSSLIGKISDSSKTVSSSSEELSAVSAQMLAGAEEMVNQAGSVASSTEQMGTNINTMASAAEEMSVNSSEVAGAAEQTSQNMNAVSSAVEEMSVSISQIAKDAGQARNVAEEATRSSHEATATMGSLSDAAKEIGNVTEVIKRIAEQTNLLALNATIEAASAGEAGKGFAVVANEIKELANQSAQAADDIAGRIEGVQGNTDDAVHVIHGVSEIIEQIGATVNNIAQAVEQQSRAVNDISANVVQASTGTNSIASSIAEVANGATDVSRNAGEASRGADVVSSNISGIRTAAQEASGGAGQVNTAAKELARMAVELENVVGEFKL